MTDLRPSTRKPLEPFAYQLEGAAWIASRERAGLLDRPRVGKTPQIIRAVDLRRLKRGLIICPAHLREAWIREFRRFSVFERRICRGMTIHDFVAWSRGVFDIMVISYEKAVTWRERFDEHGEILDFVAMDEFHYLTHLNSARTKACIGPEGDGIGGIAQWALQAWPVTGTIMTSDPTNCYAFLRFVGAIDMPFATFTRQYFKVARASTWGQRFVVKKETADQLRSLITQNSISRTLKQIGYQLPPIHLTTCMVDGDTSGVRNLLKAHPGLDDAIVAAIEKGGISFIDSQHIATLRRLLGEAKALPYASMLIDELRADPEYKVVVMGISRNALATIQEKLLAAGVWAVLVQGGVSETDREQMIKDFQEKPTCRVFIGNIKAAGTGTTLTSACHLDMFEWEWTPGPNYQALLRICGVTQLHEQHARFITLARSLDVVVSANVSDRVAAIAALDIEPMMAMAESA